MELKNLKPISITYDGINFRSKLETRYYIFFKSLGFDIEYDVQKEQFYLIKKEVFKV